VKALYIKGVRYVMSETTFDIIQLYLRREVPMNFVRYALRHELIEQNIPDKTKVPLKTLYVWIVDMIERKDYYEVEIAYFRCQVMLEFISEKKKKTPEPFFESRTWHYIKKEIERRPNEYVNYDAMAINICKDLEDDLLDEAWYQIIVVPSIIDAFRKKTIKKPDSYRDYSHEFNFVKALIGYEAEKVDLDEIEGYEVCKTYRYMVNYRTSYEFDHDRIESDLKKLEDCIKTHTLADFTGEPMTKRHIVSLMKHGYWERLFRTLYRCWIETGMWWGGM